MEYKYHPVRSEGNSGPITRTRTWGLSAVRTGLEVQVPFGGGGPRLEPICRDLGIPGV